MLILGKANAQNADVQITDVAINNAPGADVPGAIKVCYDFSCKTTSKVQFNTEDWNKVTVLFEDNADAWEERQKMLEAVATIEEIVGTYTPTYRDVGKNWPINNSELAGKPGQMDCIDESINSTTYLKMMEREGLFKFHIVRDRAYRKSFLRQHWAAQIVETRNGHHYIIDSWFKDNGELPYLVKGEAWHNLGLF